MVSVVGDRPHSNELIQRKRVFQYRKNFTSRASLHESSTNQPHELAVTTTEEKFHEVLPWNCPYFLKCSICYQKN